MGRFPPMPHTFFQMARRLEVIHLLNSSKQLIHERTETYEIGPFERVEVVDTAINIIPLHPDAL